MELSPQERALCVEVEFSEEVALSLKNATGNAVEQAFCYDDELEAQPFAALSSVWTNEQARLEELRALLPEPYCAFWGIRRKPNGLEIGRELVVLHDAEPMAFVRCRRPDGANYHLSHEMVLARLEEWHARLGVSIRGADHDQVEFEFERLPDDVMALVEEIY